MERVPYVMPGTVKDVFIYFLFYLGLALTHVEPESKRLGQQAKVGQPLGAKAGLASTPGLTPECLSLQPRGGACHPLASLGCLDRTLVLPNACCSGPPFFMWEGLMILGRFSQLPGARRVPTSSWPFLTKVELNGSDFQEAVHPSCSTWAPSTACPSAHQLHSASQLSWRASSEESRRRVIGMALRTHE